MSDLVYFTVHQDQYIIPEERPAERRDISSSVIIKKMAISKRYIIRLFVDSHPVPKDNDPQDCNKMFYVRLDLVELPGLRVSPDFLAYEDAEKHLEELICYLKSL